MTGSNNSNFWKSLSEETKQKLSNVLKGKLKTSAGYIWKYSINTDLL
jgi:hypothetical protein